MNKQQTWNLLAKVAQSKSAEAQTQLVKARQNLEEVAKSEKRLQDLYADYSARLQPGGPSCTMAEAKNLRGFIEHIETLHQSLIKSNFIIISRFQLRKSILTHQGLEVHVLRHCLL